MADKKTPTRKTAARKTTREAPARKAAPRKRAPKAVAVDAAPVAPPTSEQIATRAYQLWESGGRDPVANWLAAEQQLSASA